MSKKPRILIYDIETSLAVVTSFSLYPNFLSHNSILNEPYIICASWKFLGEDKVHSIAVTKEEALKGDDRNVVAKLHEVVESSDIIVGHNGDKFDFKWIKGRGLKYGLRPLLHVKSIDTLKVSRRHFKLMSNRLDYIGQFLGLGRKIKTSDGLWMQVLRGKVKAIREMVTYNKQDVLLLEAVYLKLRPYIDNHPNIAAMLKAPLDACKACGSSKTVKNGLRYANRKKYQKLVCRDCNHVFTTNQEVK